MKILVINCGSSSLKYQLIDMEGEKVLCKGLCERIGMESSMITHEANGHKATTPAIFPTHTEAFTEVVKKMTTGEGKVVDTSMGMTPLAGLMMGTRCGDLDPSVVNYLKYTLNITGHELDEILNKKSGLLGISGVSSDKRDVEEAAAAGNKRAQLASDMLNYQIKKTIGSYIAAMGGVDAIVFTGGIGEHDAIARAKICHHMDWLGIRIDTDKNRDAHKQKKDVVEVTAWGARVRTLIIETNEELMIARDTKEVIEK